MTPTDFDAATQRRDAIDASMRDASAAVNALTNELCGNAPRLMGLTPDSVTSNLRWQAAITKAKGA